MDHEWKDPCPTGEEAQAVFDRVWRRVMAGREEAPQGEVPALPGESAPPAEEAPLPAEVLPREGEGRHRGSDFPGAEDVPCLGPASAVHSGMLQQAVLSELQSWQFFRTLARRAGTSGRTLSAIASDDHRHARRLSTAAFLITGARWWPVEQLSAPAIPSYLGALRRQFAAKQRTGMEYLAQARAAGDRCLRQLLEELAEEEALHAQMIRCVLEQSGFH